MTVNSYLVWDNRSRVAAAFDTGANCTGMLDVVGFDTSTPPVIADFART